MPRPAAPRLTPTRKDAVKTRIRLLETAGLVFARHGFQAASLRTICRRANVNLGAVKYYFGSKEALYREVLVESHRRLIEERHVPVREDFEDPRQALEAWIHHAANLILLRRAAHPFVGRMVVHELIQPTGALDDLVQTVLLPFRQSLAAIIAALLERDIQDAAIGHLVNMTFFLLVQHEHGRPILERLGFSSPRDKGEVAALADKIYRFALAGILAHRPAAKTPAGQAEAEAGGIIDMPGAGGSR